MYVLEIEYCETIGHFSKRKIVLESVFFYCSRFISNVWLALQNCEKSYIIAKMDLVYKGRIR